ncbi:hypothetical protein [Streptomyces acidiscabies]|uniref:Integral membrane protein n=1 Tax=Streptomyces acidiscabies TaxID=42234 RepID=A0AAP6B9T1_9ACTN|nr:hypothetical protein [Streptomyces acidiscabies]MBP5937089.1 hypothetical protein [Streptomyces sp. LBUM 1476]MBZ3914865.1 hypothetical protein [Streptomyces acidiscabies]MDX2960683.1 hypothetical protein [Streptomyces acidiscabies]MDX3020781.1 hypothetical protein [Streptomyces acidiscabies]MDX3792848.1 hypothetical protein [Streptomyces acidiscabies]
MIFEALASAMLGLALAWAAVRRLPHRLPAASLVLTTGTAGALFGDFVTHTAFASGLLPSLLGAVVVATASLSLLLRPSAGRLRERSIPA